MFLEDIQNRVRLSGAEVVRPDLVGVLPEEELHGVHVPLGEVDDMNVVPGHEKDSLHWVRLDMAHSQRTLGELKSRLS